MILVGLEDVAIEPAVLKNPCFDPEFRSVAHLELDFWQKWQKLANLTLKYSRLTLKMTFEYIFVSVIESAILQNPHLDTGISSLGRLEPILEMHPS